MQFEDGGGYNAAMDADDMPAHDDVLQQAVSPSRTSRRCSFPVQPCSFLHCPVAQGQSVLNDVAHCSLTRQPFLLHLALVFPFMSQYLCFSRFLLDDHRCSLSRCKNLEGAWLLFHRLTMEGDQGFGSSPSTTVKNSLDSLGDVEGGEDEADIDKTSFTARTQRVAARLKVSKSCSCGPKISNRWLSFQASFMHSQNGQLCRSGTSAFSGRGFARDQ